MTKENKNIIRKILSEIFNIRIGKVLPRHSTKFAKEHLGDKEIRAIEVGVADGRNAASILKELNIRHIYLIDSYEDKNYSIENAKEGLRKHNHKITWIIKKSSEAFRGLPEADFIYIDGNHDYEFAKEDMINYWKVLKKGGIMAGHDINNNDTGVAKAFFEFCNENKLEPIISGTDWWVIK